MVPITNLVFALLAASPQSTPYPQELTGPTQKKWVEVAIDEVLGTGTNCTEGREYVFAADQTGNTRFCNNGTIVNRQFTWTYSFDGIDFFVTFNDTQYRLILSEKIDEASGIAFEEARLRTDGMKQENKTVDIVLTRAK